ncbi:RHS repeat-associated core domain-containing protein [Pseudomonas sp. UBA6562]|uniref:RHS repeat-associated core domain-containing protein n=1 Tax=Pseudomonas sp. UBA6562 TaxID=1947332 RepID=UPI0025E5A994|nr:RHS repeat-associated core domain-containing protein [Pseudomonas sp. UBA6562]
MSEDFGGFDCIAIDERSGSGKFILPIAGMLHEEQGPLFTLELDVDLISPQLNFFGYGTWSMYWGGLDTATTKLSLNDVPFTNGQRITCDVAMEGFTRGENYFVDAELFNQARVEAVRKGGSYTAVTGQRHVTVMLKNGTAHVYELMQSDKTASGYALLTQVVAPSGTSVDFSWTDKDRAPRVQSLTCEGYCVLKADWVDSTLQKLEVFPGSEEAKTFSINYSGKDIEITLTGDTTHADQRVYRLKTNAKQVECLDVIEIYTEPTSCIHTHQALFTYSKGKIGSYRIQPHGYADQDSLIAVYTYASVRNTHTTTVTCSRGLPKDTPTSPPQHVGLYTYCYEHDRLAAFKVEAGGTVEEIKHTLTVLESEQRVRLTATRSVDAEAVGSCFWEFDASGNLVKHDEADVVTEWTYYNDYDVYEIKETSERVSTVSGENWLSQAPLAAVDYANPIGWGFLIFGKSGLTWYKVLHSTVNLSHAGTTYAKKAFQLPLELAYPGATTGFSSHPESELTSIRQGGVLHAQSLTFYGYQKFVPIKQPHVRRAHVLKPSHKLTILEPDFERVDISALQLEIAKTWAKPFTDSLKAQMTASVDAEEKAQFVSMQASLEKSLKQQSEQNASGFKLRKPWRAMSMRVDELSYGTDPKKPGFACLKKSTAYALDQDGAAIASKKIVTALGYSQPSTPPHRITVTATVSAPDGVTTTSSTTRSHLTGRLYQKVDGDGQVTELNYTSNGLLASQSLSSALQPAVIITYTLTPLPSGHVQHQVQNSEFGHGTRVTIDQQGRVRAHWLTRDGKNWLLQTSSEYDREDLEIRLSVFDYDAKNLLISEHETVTTFAAEDDARQVVRTLKDGKGNVVDSKTIVTSRIEDGLKAVHGDFTLKQTWDAGTRTQALISSVSNSTKDAFKIQTSYDVEGHRTAVIVGTVEGTKTHQREKVEFKYDRNGWLTESHRTAGNHSVKSLFDYDSFGRLTSQNSNGIVINNTYAADTRSPIATRATITDSSGGASLELGSQSVDSLGRLSSRSVGGVVESFNDEASPGSQDTPPVLDGYACKWDSANQTLLMDCPVGLTLDRTSSTTLRTAAAYSAAGQLLRTTDIADYVMHYKYDAFGRLTALDSDTFRAAFTYRDDGLPLQETVEDISGQRTMTVAYTYDLAGNEISRRFTCPGMPSHELKRTLLADGKLSKSELLVDKKSHSSDAYQYDSHGRLIQWDGDGKYFKYKEGAFAKQTFDYDVLGNVTSTQCSEKNQRPGAWAWSATFDRSFSSSKPGVLVKHDKTAIVSDAKGRWVSNHCSFYGNGQPKVSGGMHSNDHRVLTYGYDDLGRLRGIHLKASTEAGYRFHYRAGQVYARSQVFTPLSSNAKAIRRDVLMLNESTSCYLQECRDDGERVTRTFELRDAAGTIFATVGADHSIAYHVYSPYGFIDAAPTGCDWLGYKGEPLLPDGNYYLGNYRLYNPALMSFQSPDSLSPFGDGGPATYAYCSGDPINYHDPSGHQRVAQYSRKASGTLLETKEFRYVMAATGLLSAPFTGGTSLGLAIAVTGLAVAASGFEIASLVIEDSNPELAQTLDYIGLGVGMFSAGAGFAIAARTAGATAGRAVIGSSMTGSSLPSRGMRAGRPPAVTHTAPKKGLYRFGFKADSVPTLNLSQHPAGIYRVPQWFSETPALIPSSTLWGADQAIRCHHVQEPLIRISRRNSASPIHIYSGAHGRKWGDNWISYQNPQGRNAYRRNPRFNEKAFFYEDINAYEHLTHFDRKKPLVTKYQVDVLNQIRGTSDDVRIVRRALRKRKIHIHDLSGINNRGITPDTLDLLERQPGHHIGAFCFSRNDERWLHEYLLPPVTSWI